MKVSCVLCLDCGSLIRSYHRRDYRTCSCENQAMNDGGSDYQRRGAMDLSRIVGGTLNEVTGEFLENKYEPDPYKGPQPRWPY